VKRCRFSALDSVLILLEKCPLQPVANIALVTQKTLA